MATTAQDRRHTRAGRFYDVKGVGLLPSVTTILGAISRRDAIVQWSASVEREMVIEAASQLYVDCEILPRMSKVGWMTTLADRIGKAKANVKELEKAAAIGSQAHALIEWKLKAKMCMNPGPMPECSDKAAFAFIAWEKWADSVRLEPAFVEQVVYSRTYGFAGTLDLFAEVNGVPTVIDWKTGKRVYPEAHLQNAAYRHALREMKLGYPEAGMIVRLPKVEGDPDFEAVPAMPEDECLLVFLHTLELWKWENAQAEKEAASKEAARLAKATPDDQIEQKLRESLETH